MSTAERVLAALTQVDQTDGQQLADAVPVHPWRLRRALIRLQRHGAIVAWQTYGDPRRMYAITDLGRAYLGTRLEVDTTNQET